MKSPLTIALIGALVLALLIPAGRKNGRYQVSIATGISPLLIDTRDGKSWYYDHENKRWQKMLDGPESKKP